MKNFCKKIFLNTKEFFLRPNIYIYIYIYIYVCVCVCQFKLLISFSTLKFVCYKSVTRFNNNSRVFFVGSSRRHSHDSNRKSWRIYLSNMSVLCALRISGQTSLTALLGRTGHYLLAAFHAGKSTKTTIRVCVITGITSSPLLWTCLPRQNAR